MEEIKKSCENCRYFEPHYFWYLNKFRKTCCGHCITASSYKLHKVLPSRKSCDRWESNEKKLKEQQERIDFELKSVIKQLNYLAQFFKSKED